MADLDEALFPLAGLLDFSADLTREGDRDRLHIGIYAMETDSGQMERRARSALEMIPALQAACEENSLFFSIDVRMERQIVLNRFGKRRIVDRRCTN